MQGLYNGLELALALLENREPVFKDAPEVWGKDRRVPEGSHEICE